MDIQFSIIIPAYNRAHQLLLTLASFNNQINSKGSYEVIVVDDGSTDDTREIVQSYPATYPLTYTNTERNTGRSCARNRGIALAKGHYVIFCDSDFFVIPKFIQIVREYHRRYSKSVISGVPYSWNSAYTHYYPDFPQEQKVEMYQTLQPYGLWHDSFWGEEKRIVSIVKQEDIYNNNFAKIKHLLTPWTLTLDTNKEKQQAKVAPWLLFVTRCVSVEKQYLERVGGFDENFLSYGLEDWELGFRLHQLGLSFVSIDKTVGYHQEHPRSWSPLDAIGGNLRIIYNKFGFSEPELNLLALAPPWVNQGEYTKNIKKWRKYKKENRVDEVKRLENKWKRKAIDFYEKQ